MLLINKNDIKLRGKQVALEIIKKEDAEEYYIAGFKTPDKQVDYYTGTKSSFTEDQILSYINRIVDDETRYDFKIVNKSDKIIGEVVLNNIDTDSKSSNLRIALFSSAIFGKGLGSEAINLALNFAFKLLMLHRVELEVYSFNTRGYKAYIKAGFIEEGRRRDTILIEGEYRDSIIMSILDYEYKNKRLENKNER